MESHKILPMLSSDVDVLVVHGDEGSHEEDQTEYRQFLAEVGPEAFKRPLLTHRNAITRSWKRVGRVSRDNTKARESILEEDLAKNMSLSLHNPFCLNRESKVKGLPNQAKSYKSKGSGCGPTNS